MHFIIFDKSTLDILNSYEAESKVEFGGDWGNEDKVVHLSIPEELDVDTVKCVAFDDVGTTNYRIEVDPVLLAAKQVRIKEELIAQARAQMDADILEGCKLIYGSMTAEAMLSWEAQWTRMAASPAEFIGKFGFTTIEQVSAYVQNKISTVSIPAGLYRLERIEQYSAEVNAILAQ